MIDESTYHEDVFAWAESQAVDICCGHKSRRWNGAIILMFVLIER
jgi:hypothetical protein